MHPVASAIAEYVTQNSHLFIATLYLITTCIANINTPVQHSLLVTTASWTLIWIWTVLRAGIRSGNGNTSRRSASITAGGLLALAQICERAARDRQGIWWTKTLVPLCVYAISESGLLAKPGVLPVTISLDDQTPYTSNSEKASHSRSTPLLLAATLSAIVALAAPYNLSTTTVLGLCSALCTALGLLLLEQSIKSTKDDASASSRGFVSANGSFSRRNSAPSGQQDHYFVSLRDAAAVMVVVCGVAAYLMESFRADAIVSGTNIATLEGDWKIIDYQEMVRICIYMIFMVMMGNVLMFMMLHQQGILRTSFVALASCLYTRLNFSTSLSGVWFTTLFASAAILFLYNPSSSASSILDRRNFMRIARIVILLAFISLSVLGIQHLSGQFRISRSQDPRSDATLSFGPPTSLYEPVPVDLKRGHPVDQLIKSSDADFQELLDRQSKSLAEAVAEYRRRSGISPPPHFDKWYELAQRSGVQLIDEFDTINESLLPFWGLKPSTIRARLREILGMIQENSVIGVAIRGGEVVKVENGAEWQQKATIGMMQKFIQHLPDMDLAFNIHDEPRVVVSHDELSYLVANARDKQGKSTAEIIGKSSTPRNAFSSRPADVNDGKRFDEAKTTRFNKFAHQQTWTHSRLSCAFDSPARRSEDQQPDNFTSYALGPLGFVYNATAFGNICNSPSLRQTYGFFERPNAFNIIHELVPIFSQSKISSFQDIIYPSPWYWDGKVGYDEERDTYWENKTSSLYWRGSTTGGFSRNGGWRRQHRQHIVKVLNAKDEAKIVANKGSEDSPIWEVQDVVRKDYEKLIDVHFSHIGQCDPGDCDAQKEFFTVTDRVDGQDAWQYKHLLDMDGNAFSGRFYAFLKSKSLTYKMAIFQEWHKDWLKPWIHYIPLSLRGDEHLELVRYFEEEESGRRQAVSVATRSTDWAEKVLRNEDFEVWFFRLLLEYARIIDDDRDIIGYAGP